MLQRQKCTLSKNDYGTYVVSNKIKCVWHVLYIIDEHPEPKLLEPSRAAEPTRPGDQAWRQGLRPGLATRPGDQAWRPGLRPGLAIRPGDQAVPSRAVPSRAEPFRAEPSRAYPSRAEPSRAEPATRPGDQAWPLERRGAPLVTPLVIRREGRAPRPPLPLVSYMCAALFETIIRNNYLKDVSKNV